MLCASTLAFFLSMSMYFPTLPKEVRALGGSPTVVGVIVGAYSISALFLRPFTGRFNDTRGRRLFLGAGCVVMLGVSAGLGLFRSLPAFFLVRLAMGLGIACYYPAATSLVADLAPPARRGEILGWFSIFLNLGVALGPFLGETLLAWRGFGTVCVAGVVLACVGLVAVSRIHDDRPSVARLPEGPLLAREALFPGVVNGLAAVAYAVASSFVPLWALHVGLRNSGVFFLVFAGTIVAVRPVAGRLSDTRGRRVTCIPGLFLCGVSMLVLAAIPSVFGILMAGGILGLAWGALVPGLTAFTLDRVPETRRGSTMGTFTAFVDLGIGGGAWIIGALVDAFDFRPTFVLASLPCFAGAILFTWLTRPATAPTGAVVA